MDKAITGLALNTKEMGIVDLPDPGGVVIPLKNFDPETDALMVKIGGKVVTGEELFPGVYSTATGVVRGMDVLQLADGKFAVLGIDLEGGEEFDPAIEKVPDFSSHDPVEILKTLNRYNLNFSREMVRVNTAIISAVDTDPLAAAQQQILRENHSLLAEGLELVRFLTGAKKLVLAIPKNLAAMVADIIGDRADIFPVDPVFPRGLPEILLENLNRRLALDTVSFVRIEKVLGAVSALKRGRPFDHKVVTVRGKSQSRNVRVRIGTPIQNLFSETDIRDNDKIILGGPLRGDACYSTDIPLLDSVDLVYLQDASEVVKNPNRPCINCGKCVRVCPVDLDVNLLGRFSEFALFEECRELDIFLCFECGLCAYHCPAGRSLVQLIRLAKSELGRIDRELEK